MGMNIEARRKWRIIARRRPDRDEGSVLVEFALVLPIFAIMLFGMIQFGIIFNGWTSVRNSVQTGARLGSINDFGSDCTADSAGSSCCPQGTSALRMPSPLGADMYLGTANLLCTVAGLIGQPVGTTGNPEIDLLVQNGLLTVCSQVQAQPLTGLFPAMTLSTTSTFYIEQPAAASLSASVAGRTVIGQNETLTYKINGVSQTSRTIAPSPLNHPYDPTELAGAIQAAVDDLTVTANGNSIELTTVPYASFVELQVTRSPPPLRFSGTDDNGLLENYDPNSVQACAGS